MEYVEVVFTLSDIEQIFIQAEEILGPELFQLWIDGFWSDFSANGGVI